MSTTIRPELSPRNKYWIDKHRYYELKHFCLQYPLWKNAYIELGDISGKAINSDTISKTNVISKPVERCAEARVYYSERMRMVEDAAKEATPELANYILKAVTEGVAYDYLKVRLNVPCCKDTYYELYRRFFWLLSKVRG